MSATDRYNLTWDQARALALAGTQVRRHAWQQWLYHTTGLWWLVAGANTARVVQVEDFRSADFLAADWTTADPAGVDVCSLAPPGIPAFNPPALSAAAAVSGGDLVITAMLGAATYGAYWLTFRVNGATVYAIGADEAGTVTATVTAPDSVTSISVLVQSVLPLPAWEVDVDIPPPAVAFYTCGPVSWYSDGEATPAGTYSFPGTSMPGAWSRYDTFGGSQSMGVAGGYFVPVIGTNFYSTAIIARDFTMNFTGQFSDASGLDTYYNNIQLLLAAKGDSGAYFGILAPSTVDSGDEDPSNAILYTCTSRSNPFAWTLPGGSPQAAPPDQGTNTDYACSFSRSGNTLTLVIGDQTMTTTIPAGVGAGLICLGFWYDTVLSGGIAVTQIPKVKDIVITVP